MRVDAPPPPFDDSKQLAQRLAPAKRRTPGLQQTEYSALRAEVKFVLSRMRQRMLQLCEYARLHLLAPTAATSLSELPVFSTELPQCFFLVFRRRPAALKLSSLLNDIDFRTSGICSLLARRRMCRCPRGVAFFAYFLFIIRRAMAASLVKLLSAPSRLTSESHRSMF